VTTSYDKENKHMISELIQKISNTPGCKVLPPTVIPDQLSIKLPEDVIEFYTLCGGVCLYDNAPYFSRIVSPNEFASANRIILGDEIIDNEIEKGTYDQQISKEWYIIADLYNSDYIVIDMNEERKGKCYQAFWETYPEEDNTPIISLSFTELLIKLINNKGEYWFFLEDDFESYGDAYD